MSDAPPDGDESDPAARRASELLLVLRDAPPAPSRALVARIVRRARVQHAVARPLRLFGAFAAALIDGMRAATATGRRRR